MFSVTPTCASSCKTSLFLLCLENFDVRMWRTELQDVKEEFQLIQFRLLYSNSGDFAESPVSKCSSISSISKFRHCSIVCLGSNSLFFVAQNSVLDTKLFEESLVVLE